MGGFVNKNNSNIENNTYINNSTNFNNNTNFKVVNNNSKVINDLQIIDKCRIHLNQPITALSTECTRFLVRMPPLPM
jgi:hypothetical protein